jgi:hypothetical protein
MASTIKLSVTDSSSSVELTLKDPIGPNNTWFAGDDGVLSKNSGTWNQLMGSGDLTVRGGKPEELVLTIKGINTYNPSIGQTGTGVHFGSGGLIADNATVQVSIVEVK